MVICEAQHPFIRPSGVVAQMECGRAKPSPDREECGNTANCNARAVIAASEHSRNHDGQDRLDHAPESQPCKDDQVVPRKPAFPWKRWGFHFLAWRRVRTHLDL